MRLLPKGATCAEIGVWQGDFAACILSETKPHRLHLIDPWRFESDPVYAKSWYGGGIAKSQNDMDAICAGVYLRFDDSIARGLAKTHRVPSAEAACIFDDESFDWVYIDGNHLYEFVMRDLMSYLPKVKRRGLLEGDDCLPESGGRARRACSG